MVVSRFFRSTPTRCSAAIVYTIVTVFVIAFQLADLPIRRSRLNLTPTLIV